jgi:hypothetical protein
LKALGGENQFSKRAEILNEFSGRAGQAAIHRFTFADHGRRAFGDVKGLDGTKCLPVDARTAGRATSLTLTDSGCLNRFR